MTSPDPSGNRLVPVLSGQPAGTHAAPVPVAAASPGAAVNELMLWCAARTAGYPALPVDDGASRYGVRRLTAGWLFEARSPRTRTAHDADLGTFLAWCERERLDPLTARATDLGQYRVWRELHGPHGRPAKPSTVNRALASLSSWYTYLLTNTAGVLDRNPVTGVQRLEVDHHVSRTVGLTEDEVDRLLAAADEQIRTRETRLLTARRDRALLWLLADRALPVAEAVGLDVADQTRPDPRGRLALRAPGGGDQGQQPASAGSLHDYLRARARAAGMSVDELTGPLFAGTGSDDGRERLTELEVTDGLRRLVRAAGVRPAHRLSRRWLCEAFAGDAEGGVGFTAAEVTTLLACAEQQVATWSLRLLAAWRDRALLRMLADLGLRISEALDRDISDLTANRGQRTLCYIGKGGRARERTLPAHTLEGIDEYLQARAAAAAVAVDELAGPLFATTSPDGGVGRLAEPEVFLMIRRLAKACGIAAADRLSPHSLRHAFATGSREAGVPLEDVQDAMGHADPRTTRRYDRDRHNLDRDPSLVLGARRASRRSASAKDA
ncbi:tyrosine-type recombinase/integrase [Actinoplanes sp. G11-F43]|uniref:tyrosine-type recombinase/integrase n=1 Tax=Actinoplanes sp. G11-F43 TaxID=3424130 RepID=UPI003D34691D